VDVLLRPSLITQGRPDAFPDEFVGIRDAFQESN
jgi:hypothetical protein